MVEKISNRTLKILMVEPLEDGGIAHYAHNLMNTLVRKGVDAVLFTSESYELKKGRLKYPAYCTMFKLAAIAIKLVPALNDEKGLASFIRRFLKLIEYPFNVLEALMLSKKKGIRILHLQSVNLVDLLFVIIFKIFGAKLIYTIHNVNPRHKKMLWYHKMLYRKMYSICDRLIIHSERGKEEIIELFGIDFRKISVIPHGNYNFFVPKEMMPKNLAKSALGISDEWKTILFFGAIRDNKGLANILHAMPLIKEKNRKVKLLIIGEPYENYKRYRKIINDKEIEENVYEKLEYVENEDIAKYFFATDVVVLPYNEITQSGVFFVGKNPNRYSHFLAVGSVANE